LVDFFHDSLYLIRNLNHEINDFLSIG